VASYGTGTVSTIAGDEFAIQISYANGGLSLLFPVAGAPGIDDRQFDDKFAARDIEGFLAANPGYRGVTLSSVSVAGSGSFKKSFYHGRLTRGTRLYDSILKADLHGAAEHPVPLGLVAGGGSSLGQANRIAFPDEGLVIFFNKPVTRADVLRAQLNEDEEPPRVVRMTIYTAWHP
jgi:hypothetical protein